MVGFSDALNYVFLTIWSFLSFIEDTEVVARSGKNILQAITKIDLGAQTQLLANPGSTVQIHYEITNLREVQSFHNFQVVDEQRFLRSLNPVSWVLLKQTRAFVIHDKKRMFKFLIDFHVFQ